MLKNTGTASLRQENPAHSDHDPPIDLVHLARQSQGDPTLEQELLVLFAPLAGSLALQLSDPQMRLELKANIAHKLRGSALAIGAWRIARAAEAIEGTARSADGECPGEAETTSATFAIAALQAAVAEAIAQIERLRR